MIPREHFICDRICKKGSYTRTTSEHRFHHHSMDTSSDNPCVHVLWPTVYQFVLTRLCWLFNKGYQAVTSLTWPCSDIIYRFNYFLGQFKHQCIHKTSVTTQRVFSPPLRGSPPPPTNHPYVFTCGTDEKNYLKWRAIQLTSHQTEHQLNYLV